MAPGDPGLPALFYIEPGPSITRRTIEPKPASGHIDL